MKVAEKWLLVPDCDDDRTSHETREFLNPRYLTAQAEVYGKGVAWDGPRRYKVLKGSEYVGGWHPPYSMKQINGEWKPVLWEEEKTENPKTLRGGIHALMFIEQNGYRIFIIGADDTYRERSGLTERKAKTLWDRLNHFVTLKTLWRLGF